LRPTRIALATREFHPHDLSAAHFAKNNTLNLAVAPYPPRAGNYLTPRLHLLIQLFHLSKCVCYWHAPFNAFIDHILSCLDQDAIRNRGLRILLDPMLAGFAMSLSSVCVVSNALRLRSKKL